MRVLVLGLGPAGSSFILSSPGDLEIDAYEALGYPRSSCAGGLGLWALKELNRYGSVFTEAYNHANRTNVESFEFFLEDGKHRKYIYIHKRDLGFDRLGIVMDRKAFDRYLFNKAVERANILKRLEPDQIKKYDVVVDARGMSSLPPISEDDIEILLQYHIETNDVEPNLVVYFKKDLVRTGYFWEFPEVKSGINKVGFGLSISEYKEKGLQMRDYLEKYMTMRGIKGRIVRSDGGRLPLAKPKPEYLIKFENGKWIYKVGTAGGLVDPVSGAGIRYAIRSGVALARTLNVRGYIDALSSTMSSFARRYYLKNMITSSRRIDTWLAEKIIDLLLIAKPLIKKYGVDWL